MKDFDAIIIGSGIGGLCAGALLASFGYRVLILERLPFIGGRFSSIIHKGYTFTTGAVSIEGGGSLYKIFKELALPFDLIYPEPQVTYRIGNRDLILPKKEGLEFLIYAGAKGRHDGQKIVRAIRDFSDFHLQDVSLFSWLRGFTDDQGIFGIFKALCGAIFSTSIQEASVVEFIRMVRARSFRKFGFPKMGNSALVEELNRAIVRRGGELLLRCEARKIVVENGEARGVKWERNGKMEEATASVIISNVGVKRTVELAGEKWFTPDELLRTKSMRPSCTLTIEILSDRPLVEYPGVIMLPQARRAAFMTCPTITCPELAPEGKHFLTILGPPLSSEEPFNGAQEFMLLLEDARENIPHLERDARRFIFRSFRKEWPGFRARPGDDMPQETSIVNLYNVGDSVKPPGLYGVGACVESSIRVVEKIRGKEN